MQQSDGVSRLAATRVEVGADAYVGARAMLLGCRVPPGAVVGAGSVVTKDFAPEAARLLIAGNPARHPQALPAGHSEPGGQSGNTRWRQRKWGIVKLHIIVPALPPQLDGIGDYTAALAAQIVSQSKCAVTILTGTEFTPAPIAGARIVPTFCFAQPASVAGIREQALVESPGFAAAAIQPVRVWQAGPELASAPRPARCKAGTARNAAGGDVP